MYFDWLNFLSDGAGSDKGHKFHGSTPHEIGGSESKLRACSLDEPVGLERRGHLSLAEAPQGRPRVT